MLRNIGGLKREEFTYLLKQSLEKVCTTILNQSGWSKSGVYPFEHDPVWCLRKVDIKASDAALATAEPLTSPAKSSELLKDLNKNDVDALTTALATKLARKRRCAEAISDAQA